MQHLQPETLYTAWIASSLHLPAKEIFNHDPEEATTTWVMETWTRAQTQTQFQGTSFPLHGRLESATVKSKDGGPTIGAKFD